ncbi:hypothetical protein AQUCO_07100004v1 [Aquilegia coerulea]|uniref:Uncharacterized protein n=1 Tax=Aquilegia coerulea TaxID=218851 RepID=A0A2G5CBT9_AQUCA|nr:hypothetical protein AQUCO_07100004v1 [Aquilegia coerulea]
MQNEVPTYNSQMLNAAGYMNLDDRIARGPRMASDGRPMVVSTQNAGKVNNSVNIPPVNQNPSSQTMKISAMGRVTNNSSKRAQVTVPVENREVVGTMDNTKNVRNIPEVQKNYQDKGKSVMGSVDQAPAAPKAIPRSNQVVGNNKKNVHNILEVQNNCQDKGKSVMVYLGTIIA